MLNFSVIVPIYNVEAYLHHCVESILNQSYEKFELILVDDGSPDNCPAICDAYAEKDCRVKVIHKENGGLVSARIAGASIATGDYVCCVDGDDWVHPHFLESFAEAVTAKQPDVICCGFFKAYETHEDSCFLPYRYGYYTKRELEEAFFPSLIEDEYAKYFSISIWNKAYKRTLYWPVQNAVDPKIKIGEDGACTFTIMSKADSVYILKDCLYYYRQNPASMTKEKKAFAWNGPKLLFEHFHKNMDLTICDFKDQLYRRTAHGVFTVAVSQFYRKESYFSICCDIKLQLKEPIYDEAIKKAKFKDIRGKLALFALQHKQMWLMKLWSFIDKK